MKTGNSPRPIGRLVLGVIVGLFGAFGSVAGAASDDCFGELKVKIEKIASKDRITKGTGVVDCKIESVNPETLVNLMNYLESDVVVGLRSPARGPFADWQPTIGMTSFKQITPQARRYYIQPKGLDESGAQKLLNADGNVFFSTGTLPNQDQFGIVGMVSDKIHCFPKTFKERGACWTHQIDGRTEFFLQKGSDVMRVRGILEVQVKIPFALKFLEGQIAKEIENKLVEEIRSKTKDEVGNTLNKLADQGLLPRR